MRLAEAIGVSQPTAWRMGHALRLLLTREPLLEGTVEVDEFYLGGSPRKDADRPRLGRGRKGQPRTAKKPVLAVVQRPAESNEGTAAGDARARVMADLSEREGRRVLAEHVDTTAHLMSDEWKAFVSIGQAFAAHDTVRHSEREYAQITVLSTCRCVCVAGRCKLAENQHVIPDDAGDDSDVTPGVANL